MKNKVLVRLFFLLCLWFLQAPDLFAQTDAVDEVYEEYEEESAVTIPERTVPSNPADRKFPLEQYRGFDEDQYQKTIKDVDYSERREKSKEQEREINPKDLEIHEPVKVEFMGVGQIVLIVVLGVLVVILIFLIVRQIPKSNPNVKASDDWFAEALEQEGGPEQALQKKLQQAIDQREFALALRMLFLQILADLHLSETIAWKKDKTNATYLIEFGGKHDETKFRRVIYLYEFSWFGKVKLDEEQFKDFRKQFDEFRAFTSTLKKSTKA
jgi:hypothetical protein